jgi:hypothetical protein
MTRVLQFLHARLRWITRGGERFLQQQMVEVDQETLEEFGERFWVDVPVEPEDASESDRRFGQPHHGHGLDD